MDENKLAPKGMVHAADRLIFGANQPGHMDFNTLIYYRFAAVAGLQFVQLLPRRLDQRKKYAW